MTKKPAEPPKRIDTHRTDTLAVRKLFSKLSADWIIRDLSERDYGIDLMLEYYEQDDPTGQIVFFQIKGTSKSIEIKDDLVKFPISKRTLLYAERFPEPFLLVYTSITSEEPIYFVWLQKYIAHVLDRDRPRWRNEFDGNILINIPVANTFNENERRLLEISKANVLQRESLRFLSSFLFWEFDYGELKNGDFSFISACKKHLEEFKKLSVLFNKYNQNQQPNYKEVEDCLDVFDSFDAKNFETIKQFDELLDFIKTSVLTESHQEQFAEEMLGEFPY